MDQNGKWLNYLNLACIKYGDGHFDLNLAGI